MASDVHRRIVMSESRQVVLVVSHGYAIITRERLAFSSEKQGLFWPQPDDPVDPVLVVSKNPSE